MRGKTMKLRRVLDTGEVYEAEIEAMDLGLSTESPSGLTPM
jgi:hypothetical protein